MRPSVGESVASNATLLIISRVLSRLVGLAVILLITRLLGAEGFGRFSFAFSFVGLIAVIMGAGLTPLVTREMARRKEEAGEYLGSAAVIKVGLLGVAILALVGITESVVTEPASRTAMYLAAVSLFAVSFTGMINGAFRAFEQTQYEVLGFVAGKLVLLSLCILCYVRAVGLTVVVGCFAGTSLLELGVAVYLLRARLIPTGFRVTARTARMLLVNALPFALSSVLGVIYFRIDVVMLRFIKGDLATGWYGGAYRFVEAVLFVPDLMAAALFPVLARKFFAGDSLSGIFGRSFRLFFTLALPFALGATFFPRVTRLLGSEFGGSEEVLPYLGWTLFLLFMNYLFVTTLNSAERQRQVTVALGCGALANILLNLLFVPRWGHVGAGVATLISTALVFAVEWAAVRQCVEGSGIRRAMIGRPLVAGCVLGVMWFFLRGENILWVVPAGGAVYVLALVLLKGLPSEDWRLLKGALQGARTQAVKGDKARG
ncbi:MAG: flippase [Candidatus Eisenbacteria sp.]|nr:flippase [Candidatus Eisenbacteria bacterium]